MSRKEWAHISKKEDPNFRKSPRTQTAKYIWKTSKSTDNSSPNRKNSENMNDDEFTIKATPATPTSGEDYITISTGSMDNIRIAISSSISLADISESFSIIFCSK